jgi:hypothetical protein
MRIPWDLSGVRLLVRRKLMLDWLTVLCLYTFAFVIAFGHLLF